MAISTTTTFANPTTERRLKALGKENIGRAIAQQYQCYSLFSDPGKSQPSPLFTPSIALVVISYVNNNTGEDFSDIHLREKIHGLGLENPSLVDTVTKDLCESKRTESLIQREFEKAQITQKRADDTASAAEALMDTGFATCAGGDSSCGSCGSNGTCGGGSLKAAIARDPKWVGEQAIRDFTRFVTMYNTSQPTQIAYDQDGAGGASAKAEPNLFDGISDDADY